VPNWAFNADNNASHHCRLTLALGFTNHPLLHFAATMQQFNRPDHSPDLEVEVHLYPEEISGRKAPLWQGCRLPHDFGLPDEFNDGMYEFIVAEPSPGEVQGAVVWLLAPERNAGRLYEGFEFRAWDNKFIATCKVLRVLNPSLVKHS